MLGDFYQEQERRRNPASSGRVLVWLTLLPLSRLSYILSGETCLSKESFVASTALFKASGSLPSPTF
jgi:hypothetical protein